MSNKTAIYYYSATGNSLGVAKQIRTKLPDSSLVPIIKYLKQGKQDINNDTVGLVFPVHKFGIPQIIHEFIEQANISANSYIFVVVTGGNPKLSACLFQVKKLLRKKDIYLNAGFHIKMPATYFSMFSLFRKGVKTLNFKKVDARTGMIKTIVQEKKSHIETGIPYLSLLNCIKNSYSNNNSQHFIVDKGCIRCGYCVMVCPMQNIQLNGGHHQFLNNCNFCFACVHYCSMGVIQFKTRTQGRPRYQHPTISIGELVVQKR